MAEAALSALFDDAQSPAVKMIDCCRCGIAFVSQHSRNVFCQECAKIARRESNARSDAKRRSAKFVDVSASCENCGVDFKKRSYQHIFCSAECKTRKASAKNIAATLAARAKIKCADCGDEILKMGHLHARCAACAKEKTKPAVGHDVLVCRDCGISGDRSSPNQVRCFSCAKVKESNRYKIKAKPSTIACVECGEICDRRMSSPYCKPCSVLVRKRNQAKNAKAARGTEKGRAVQRLRSETREKPDSARRAVMNANERRRTRSDPKFNLNKRIRASIRNSLRKRGISKNGERWQSAVGYTLPDLRLHLQRQFSRGMSWENMGEWHVDHIVPLASFSFSSLDDPEFKAAWAITNLRPLWAIENIKKSDDRIYLI